VLCSTRTRRLHAALIVRHTAHVHEAGAGRLSLALYAFLDLLVMRTTSATQLAEAQLPPLLDTDAARFLAAQPAFPILDNFSGTRLAHVALGLLRVFRRREFLVLCGHTVLKVASNFASPLGINRSLAFLENGNVGTAVRPWVSTASVFLGPFLSSVAMQPRVFLNTCRLVRTEALLTHLVLAYALHVHLKADAPPGAGTAPSTRAASPTASKPTNEAPTVTEGQADLGKGDSRAAATESAWTTAYCIPGAASGSAVMSTAAAASKVPGTAVSKTASHTSWHSSRCRRRPCPVPATSAPRTATTASCPPRPGHRLFRGWRRRLVPPRLPLRDRRGQPGRRRFAPRLPRHACAPAAADAVLRRRDQGARGRHAPRNHGGRLAGVETLNYCLARAPRRHAVRRAQLPLLLLPRHARAKQ
jgi:hypothetical protein